MTVCEVNAATASFDLDAMLSHLFRDGKDYGPSSIRELTGISRPTIDDAVERREFGTVATVSSEPGGRAWPAQAVRAWVKRKGLKINPPEVYQQTFVPPEVARQAETERQAREEAEAATLAKFGPYRSLARRWTGSMEGVLVLLGMLQRDELEPAAVLSGLDELRRKGA